MVILLLVPIACSLYWNTLSLTPLLSIKAYNNNNINLKYEVEVFGIVYLSLLCAILTHLRWLSVWLLKRLHWKGLSYISFLVKKFLKILPPVGEILDCIAHLLTLAC